jgi:hypothetical protein
MLRREQVGNIGNAPGVKEYRTAQSEGLEVSLGRARKGASNAPLLDQFSVAAVR